ncbi:hypothetical protein LTR50_002566 [Elasticomyces elasticus]|nr:hypothetical protein LTR50_002566 [Elasticomyces elasticus]
MPNPLTLLATPFLLVLSIPLATFAAFTTTLAFAALAVRVSIAWVDIAIALLHSAISVTASPPASGSPTAQAAKPPPSPTGVLVRKKRRSSTYSNSSDGGGGGPTQSGSQANLLGTGSTRDFEGVGGWRLVGEDAGEEALWMGINSRLELPAAPTTTAATLMRSRHRRSLTGGSQRLAASMSAEMERGIADAVRIRTPGIRTPGVRMAGAESPEGYFNAVPFGRSMSGVGEGRKGSSGSSSAGGGRVHKMASV